MTEVKKNAMNVMVVRLRVHTATFLLDMQKSAVENRFKKPKLAIDEYARKSSIELVVTSIEGDRVL